MALPCAVEPDVRSSPVAHSKLAASPPADDAPVDEPDAAELADDAEVAAALELDVEAVLLSDPQADRVSTAASAAAAPASRRLVRAIFTRIPPGLMSNGCCRELRTNSMREH